MPAAGVGRDLIIGHSMQGMDAHYIVPSEAMLTQAMDKYTRWLDDQNVDQRVYYFLNDLNFLIPHFGHIVIIPFCGTLRT